MAIMETIPASLTPRTPLPKLQIAVTFLIQFTEPLTAVVVFPFAPEFVRRTGITNGDEKKTGYYTGIIDALSFASEGLSVYFWALASDRWGRRPVLLMAPLGLALCVTLFGLSTKYWQLVLFRSLQGIFNGNIGVARTVVAELTDSTNINVVFSLMPIVWSGGMTAGNTIGGLLSFPAEKWPHVFGRFSIFYEHPFFLPCAVTSIICLISFVMALLSLKETSPSHTNSKKATLEDPSETDGLLSNVTADYGSVSDATKVAEERPSLRMIFEHVPFRRALTAYGLLSFADAGYDALLPLVYNTSVANKGLGLTPGQIGSVMGIISCVNVVFQVTFSARILDKLGPAKSLVFALAWLPLAFVAFPVGSVLASRAGHADLGVWAVVVFQMICMVGYSLAFASTAILLVQSSPSKAALARTNSIGHMTACATRAIAPWISTSLFSVSLQYNVLDGHLVYVFLITISLVAIRSAWIVQRL